MAWHRDSLEQSRPYPATHRLAPDQDYLLEGREALTKAWCPGSEVLPGASGEFEDYTDHENLAYDKVPAGQ